MKVTEAILQQDRNAIEKALLALKRATDAYEIHLHAWMSGDEK